MDHQLACENVRCYLDDLAWSYRVDNNTIHSGFNGDKKYYPLTIVCQDSIISFECIILKGQSKLDEIPNFYEFIHELNNRTALAKIVVCNDQVVMRIESFLAGMDLNTFNLNLGVLGYYADMLLDLILDVFEREECFSLGNYSIS